MVMAWWQLIKSASSVHPCDSLSKCETLHHVRKKVYRSTWQWMMKHTGVHHRWIGVHLISPTCRIFSSMESCWSLDDCTPKIRRKSTGKNFTHTRTKKKKKKKQGETESSKQFVIDLTLLMNSDELFRDKTVFGTSSWECVRSCYVIVQTYP